MGSANKVIKRYLHFSIVMRLTCDDIFPVTNIDEACFILLAVPLSPEVFNCKSEKKHIAVLHRKQLHAIISKNKRFSQFEIWKNCSDIIACNYKSGYSCMQYYLN